MSYVQFPSQSREYLGKGTHQFVVEIIEAFPRAQSIWAVQVRLYLKSPQQGGSRQLMSQAQRFAKHRASRRQHSVDHLATSYVDVERFPVTFLDVTFATIACEKRRACTKRMQCEA